MRLARPAAAVVLALGASFAAAAPASAGGPTSVLLVSPSTGLTEALYATNEAYTTLMTQLAVSPLPEEGPGRTTPGVGGDQVVVTWMIHDVQPWRVDRITFGADGLPEWIHTAQAMGEGPIPFDGAGSWHRPADPHALDDLLVDLGVVGEVGLRPAQEDPDAAGRTDETEAAAAAAASGDGPLGAATWVLPALAGGAVAGVLGDRWLRRRREDGGRWQLMDVPGSSA
jgi:hypothetical protein